MGSAMSGSTKERRKKPDLSGFGRVTSQSVENPVSFGAMSRASDQRAPPREQKPPTKEHEPPPKEQNLLPSKPQRSLSRQQKPIIETFEKLTSHGFYRVTDRSEQYVVEKIWSQCEGRYLNNKTSRKMSEWLRDCLNEAHTADAEQAFVPVDELGSIINKINVRELLNELKTCRGMPDESKDKLAREICATGREGTGSSYRRIVAALIAIGKQEYIPQMVETGFSDATLPLETVGTHDEARKGKEWVLRHRSTQKEYSVVRSWKPNEKAKFLRDAAKYHAPVFLRPKGEINHYVLYRPTALPFVPEGLSPEESNDDDTDDEHGGGFSTVQRAEFHPAHHHFGDYGGLTEKNVFAIKKLDKPDEKDFLREVAVLLRFAHLNEKQLVKLLATYELLGGRDRKQYFLIFPWAEGSVRSLWKRLPGGGNTKHVSWIASQTKAIAEALHFLHVDYAKAMDKSQDPEKYGRHGDIKAQNFLVYKSKDSPKDSAEAELGLIYLTDFGLSRFHRQGTRSIVKPRAASASYRPPEYDVKQGKLSRKSDMWSLGTFFLELITWYLYGYHAVKDEFPDARDEKDPTNDDIDGADTFFNLREGLEVAYVKSGVINWVEKLKKHEKMTPYLQRLLDFTMQKLLVCDQNGRADATDLKNTLTKMYADFEQDPVYWSRAAGKKRD